MTRNPCEKLIFNYHYKIRQQIHFQGIHPRGLRRSKNAELAIVLNFLLTMTPAQNHKLSMLSVSLFYKLYMVFAKHLFWFCGKIKEPCKSISQLFSFPSYFWKCWVLACVLHMLLQIDERKKSCVFVADWALLSYEAIPSWCESRLKISEVNWKQI